MVSITAKWDRGFWEQGKTARGREGEEQGGGRASKREDGLGSGVRKAADAAAKSYVLSQAAPPNTGHLSSIPSQELSQLQDNPLPPGNFFTYRLVDSGV